MSQASTMAYAPVTVPADRRNWTHRIAVLLMLLTFLLIVAGGNVTSKDAGLAVPDWPLSFNSVNPAGWTSNMDGTRPGVRDEHGHRLIGATVGVVVIALAVSLQRNDRRRWVRQLGWLALAAVVVQGVMGGLRVTERSLILAMIHGCFAQAFFCLTILLAMITSPRWSADESIAGADTPRNKALRMWSGALVAVVYGQLVLGALLRHLGSSHAAILHICGALVVGVALIQAAQHVFSRPESERPLARLMIGLMLLFGVQLLLGVAAYVLVFSMMGPGTGASLQAYVPTVHVAVGALILGVSFAMGVRVFVLTRPERATASPGSKEAVTA